MQNGIVTDPEKTKAIVEMIPRTDIPELRRFMGMANQLAKFTPKLAERTQPLSKLPSKGKSRMWGPSQSSALEKVKQEHSKPTTLALHDHSAPTKISADASVFGLGVVLLQKSKSTWKALAYTSPYAGGVQVGSPEPPFKINDIHSMHVVEVLVYTHLLALIHINYETEIDIVKCFYRSIQEGWRTQVYCFCDFFSIYLNKNLTF